VSEPLLITYATPPFCETKRRRGRRKTREREKKKRGAGKGEKKEEGRERQGGAFVKKLRNRIYSTQGTTHTCSGILRESAGGKVGGRISACNVYHSAKL